MAIDFDIALYREKIRRTRQEISDKSFELATSDDPFLIATLRRSLNTLNELLSIFEQTEKTLVALGTERDALRSKQQSK